MTNKPENQSANLASGIIEAMNQLRAGFMQTVTRPHCIRRSYVGYFAPLFAVYRLIKKWNWRYIHQLRVVYRYSFWRSGHKH